VEGAGDALTLVGLLGDGVRSRVDAVVVGDDGSLSLRLRPEGVVLFGPPTGLEGKVARLTTLMGQVDQRALATISVVDPNNVYVTRNPA
jgi:hypothetical protein